MGWSTFRAVAGGFLLGTAGIKFLKSKDAKKAYVHVTAAALRCADEVIKETTVVKENCQDILAEARDINEERMVKEAKQIINDVSEDEDSDLDEDKESKGI